MGIIDAITATFNIEFSNLQTLLPMVALVIFEAVLAYAFIATLPSNITSSLTGMTSVNQTISSIGTALRMDVAHVVATLLVLTLVACLAYAFVAGMYLDIVRQDNEGKGISIGAAFNVALKRYAAIIGTGIITLFTIGLVLILLTKLLSALGAVAGVIIDIILILLFYQAVPIVVIEGKGPIAAIEESVGIGINQWKSIIGTIILGGIVFAVLNGIFDLIGSSIATLLGATGPAFAVALAFSFVGAILAAPLGIMLPGTYYYEFGAP